MSMWKKLLMVSTVALTAVTLGACGNNQSSTSSSNNNSNKPLTLWVATDYVPWYKTSVK